MRLEDQLDRLAELGLPLAAGRTVDELLYSSPREEYESRPFDLLLFALGCAVEDEPWERWFCDRAWHFDTECVRGPGSYVAIARQLCRIAGLPDALSELRDHVDLGEEEAWIEYTANGRPNSWPIDVRDDWADLLVVGYLIDELEDGERRFHVRHNGQAMTLFFLDDDAAARLNALAGGEAIAPFPG
ncbi:hypothetical protein [Streptomyces sp. NBC_01435]|uniref:hypothetical protein n=1 Tax=Streptomyces sp. NBC_01435 TaxID=2903865 RepID=UPI002E37F92A|nr:hypothetical protein [Streptomyces sp. NBC_01435]